MMTAGCSYSFDISITWDDPFHPIFVMEKPYWAAPKGKTVHISNMGIYTKKNNDWDYRNPIWSFGLESGFSKKVKRIKYGEVPEGFNEYKPSKELKADVEYLVLGFGAGGRGNVQFKIIKEKNKYTIVELEGK